MNQLQALLLIIRSGAIALARQLLSSLAKASPPMKQIKNESAKKGDVVRLAGSVMLAEFGLMLCDDAGELLEIDGVIQEVLNDRARVVIKRMMPRPAPFAWKEGYTSRWVRAEEVIGIIEGEAMLWPDAARLKGVSDEREGIKTAPAPVMWTVGVEEMPAG